MSRCLDSNAIFLCIFKAKVHAVTINKSVNSIGQMSVKRSVDVCYSFMISCMSFIIYSL